ncbi:apotyrosinase chaperone MelC1 [Streptomyces yaizuensis]|uniref:Tyrosinase cofactor n=1 Tax=Streptomyces yaizuensis TaxID=2989713 RepID=A0ABQ5PAK8_9ACTN|nr:tyrosinase family oxidase copper chaperone [Streptomyces sp. YSPA8]GLF99611.1 tyrosinase cofactor [Streptomyces sp. YSPA8]
MSKITRRQIVGTVAGAAAGMAVVGAAAASAQPTTGQPRERARAGADGPAAFDEVHQGRRIQGIPAEGGTQAQAHTHAHEKNAHGHAHHSTGGYRVLVDGRELRLMRMADGWASSVNHYQRFPDPRAAARAAVVSLRGAHLVPLNA